MTRFVNNSGAETDVVLDSSGHIGVFVATGVAGGSPTPDVRSATAFHNSKATAGAVISFMASNTSSSVFYVQIYNNTSTSGSPVEEIRIPAGTSLQPAMVSMGLDDFGNNGLYCASGITWAFSTSSGSYNAPSDASGLHMSLKYT